MHDDVEALADVDVANVPYEERCVEIEGIVSPSGQAGWPRGDRDYDVHCFSFAAWRRIGETLNRRKLTILRPLPKASVGFEEFAAYSIHRLRALLSKDGTRAVFVKALPGPEFDKELFALGKELAAPVIISTETFGDLVLDRTINWFEGEAEWNGQSVEVHFHTDETNVIEGALKTAEALWSEQSKWKQRVAKYAVAELLDIKNGTWLEDDEPPLSADDFTKRMELESISFRNDGHFEFWHDDGDLFWGHSIQICGNLADGLTRADIPG